MPAWFTGKLPGTGSDFPESFPKIVDIIHNTSRNLPRTQLKVKVHDVRLHMYDSNMIPLGKLLASPGRWIQDATRPRLIHARWNFWWAEASRKSKDGRGCAKRASQKQLQGLEIPKETPGNQTVRKHLWKVKRKWIIMYQCSKYMWFPSSFHTQQKSLRVKVPQKVTHFFAQKDP